MGCLFWYVSCEENFKKNNSIFLFDHFHSLLLEDPRKIFNEAYPWIQFQTYPSPSGLSDQALLWREGDGQWEESQLISALTLGKIYSTVERHTNPAKALHYLQMAALKENEEALGLLADLYSEDQLVPQDLQLPRQYLTQAAEVGDLDAILRLGLCHIEGEMGLSVNVAEGLSLLKMASTRGHPRAGLLLFIYTFEAPEEIQDFDVAWEHLQRSAGLGCVASKYHLGRVLLQGKTRTNGKTYRIGVSSDVPRGLALLQEAAEAGELTAINSYGLFLLNGRFVDRDLAAAREWFTKSLDIGDTEDSGIAHFNIGLSYELEGLHSEALHSYQKAHSMGMSLAEQKIEEMNALI